MKIIPFLSFQNQHAELRQELMQALESCLDVGTFILGKSVEEFERTWADYCQAPWSIGVSNGLDAIVLALKACGIGQGDEVIVPAQTFIATWLAVSLVGAKPVPVDVEESSANIDVHLVEPAINSRTKAILAVDLFGQLADMQALSELCKKHKIYLVEDAAQAHGATRDGYKAGAWSDLATFSFYPGKNLGALGDAGAIIGRCPELYKTILELRNYGSKVKYVHETKGYNARMDALQARFLSVKFQYLNRWNEQRKSQAKLYLEQLQGIESLTLPKYERGSESCWHLFVVKTTFRDALQVYLKEKGIETLIHYPIPPYLQKAYVDYSNLSFPQAYKWATQGLSLPLGPHLDVASQEYVCEKIRVFFNRI